MIDLNTLTTPQLLENYNTLSGKPPVYRWKTKVSALRVKLANLKPDLYFIGNVEESLVAVAKEIIAGEEPVDHPVAAPKGTKAAKAKAPKVKKTEAATDRGAIRQYCEELLLKSKGVDPDTKRPLGLPYADILAAVTKRFPEAATSLNCLRWYATKMNKRVGKEKVVMPVRPKTNVA